MRKALLTAFAFLVSLFVLVGCSNTVADVETSSGGEVVVTESDVGAVDETMSVGGGETVTGTEDYEALTITYTDPEGYTVTESGGGVVTFTLDDYETGKIVYIPKTVDTAVMDQYHDALQADAERLKEYAAEYAEEMDVDFAVNKETVNGQEVIWITGTVAEGSTAGNPGDVGYVMIMPMGDQIIAIRGYANAETADIVKADLMTFAQSITGTPAASSTAASAA